METRDQDGLSEEQVQEFAEAFKLFDKEGKGAISIKEIGTIARSLSAMPTEGMLQEVSMRIDPESKGTIDFNAFLQVMKYLTFGLSEPEDFTEELIQNFGTFDKNGSGFISVDEIRHVLRNLGEKIIDQEIEEMIDQADVDENGRINYREFTKKLFNS